MVEGAEPSTAAVLRETVWHHAAGVRVSRWRSGPDWWSGADSTTARDSAGPAQRRHLARSASLQRASAEGRARDAARGLAANDSEAAEPAGRSGSPDDGRSPILEQRWTAVCARTRPGLWRRLVSSDWLSADSALSHARTIRRGCQHLRSETCRSGGADKFVGHLRRDSARGRLAVL